MSGRLAWTSKISAGRSTAPTRSPPTPRMSTVVMSGSRLRRRLRGGAQQDQAALGAGQRAPDEDEVVLRVDRLDGQVLRGEAHPAHPAGHPHTLEDAARGGAGADRAGRAVLALDTVAGP